MAEVLRLRPVGWRRVARGGYTAAERWVVSLEDGSSVFAKVGVTGHTAGWLRAEHNVYAHVTADFLPPLLGWNDDGDRPVLLLEDLSDGEWPPPWSPERVDRVLETLDAIRMSRSPPALPDLETRRSELSAWVRVAEDPAAFLSINMASGSWLEAALLVLLEAEASARLKGHELLHLDVRSDNLCFLGARTLLVDWNSACVGNARVDLAFWLPSLEQEGGPDPHAILPGEPELAAFVAGYFAGRTGLPPIDDAPRVRGVQLSQLRSALPWACRELGVPPPDGPPRS
ncbi:MAG: phosphotransferase [Actinomycetota bacterium]